MVTSASQIEELERVLHYPKLKHYISSEQAEVLLKNLDLHADVVIPDSIPDISSDPDDNLILAIAVTANADYLITGDKRDLLALKQVQNTPIITARTAVDLLCLPVNNV